MQDYSVTIRRNSKYNYLFDLIDYIGEDYIGKTFEEIQIIVGVKPENYSNYDDNRYLMII